MTNLAPETLTMHPAETRAAVVLFDEKLAEGDTLSGTPTAVEVAGDAALLVGDPEVADAGDVVRGQYRAAGTFIRLSVSGGTDGQAYTVRVTCTTTGGETLVGLISIAVSDEVGA